MPFVTTALMSVFSFFYLFVLARLMGNRQIAQLDAFDYIIGITIGSIGAELSTELEEPIKPIIAMGIYGVLGALMSVLALRVPRSRKRMESSPIVLFHDGKLYQSSLLKAKLGLNEFLSLCRQQGFFDLTQVYTAVFEYNGKLSILPVEEERPSVPKDFGLNPQQSDILTEIIMEGCVLEDNLKRMGKEKNWLHKQMKDQGFHSPKEIFLGQCDQKGKVTFYRWDRS